MPEPSLAELRAELDAAVRAYAAARRPDDTSVLVGRWVLVYQSASDEMHAAGSTGLDVVIPTGQDFVSTRGLLEVAVDQQRALLGISR